MKLKLQFIIALFIALAIYIPVARGQAVLTFSGGNGAPLSTTLGRAVTYTITDANCVGASNGPFFTFQGTGNLLAGEVSVTGTITSSVNGGTSQSINREGSNFIGGNTSANDIYIFALGAVPGAASGNTVVLSAGTITTTTNVGAAPPAGASFITFIANQSGVRCSSNGVAAAAPTAATVSISGRVTSITGRGIMNVRVSLTDSSGQVRTAMTGSFGHYRFDGVQAGDTYVLSATGKNYMFSQPTQVLNVNEETTEVNFIANSEKRRIIF